MAPPTHLLYLHGFRSSPQSTKARLTAAWIADRHPFLHWRCPQLPPSPADAVAMLEEAIAAWPRDRMAVIGSSLGGFYATVLAERHGCPAVLLNPAVDPARDLAASIGRQTAWNGDLPPFDFEPRFVDDLQSLRPQVLTRPQRYFAVIAKGDEVLDWKEMAARYAASPMRLLEGSDHALSNYAELLPGVAGFLGL